LNLGNKLALLRALWKLAGQRDYWSARRLFRSLWFISRNNSSQLALLRLLSRPEYRRLAVARPWFAFRHLHLDYIARGLTVDQRIACFLHHYLRLPEGLPPEPLSSILIKDEDVTVDEIRKERHCFAVKVGPPRPWIEGELSLYFVVDEQVVFVLSFTIVPGWVVQSEFDEVVLISRLQGVKGCFAEIQLATKSLGDVAPPAMLVAALCGLADAYGIRGMAGINAHMAQEHYLLSVGEAALEQAYDSFFIEIGATRAPSGFYLAPIPLPEKPMTLIKKGHKTRTREKRALKRDVAARTCRWLREPAQRM
jgi:uncharacterized protein VirK/YbjX